MARRGRKVGHKVSFETRLKMSKSQKKRFLKKDECKKLSEAQKGEKNHNYGKKRSEETRRKISEAEKGKTLTQETKRKMRIAAIKRIERKHGQVHPNYNPEACRLIEEYNEKHGYNFQHAENGGEFHIKELGYWVDGYDAAKNVVIEVDESHHYKDDKLKEKDIQRQQEIEEHLDCEFIRIRHG